MRDRPFRAHKNSALQSTYVRNACTLFCKSALMARLGNHHFFCRDVSFYRFNKECDRSVPRKCCNFNTHLLSARACVGLDTVGQGQTSLEVSFFSSLEERMLQLHV